MIHSVNPEKVSLKTYKNKAGYIPSVRSLVANTKLYSPSTLTTLSTVGACLLGSDCIASDYCSNLWNLPFFPKL